MQQIYFKLVYSVLKATYRRGIMRQFSNNLNEKTLPEIF